MLLAVYCLFIPLIVRVVYDHLVIEAHDTYNKSTV